MFTKLYLLLCSAQISNSYAMGCPPVRGDNPRALASRLSYVQVDKHGITILYHLHQCRPFTSEIVRAKVGKGDIKQFICECRLPEAIIPHGIPIA